MNPVLNQFTQFYERLTLSSLDQLESIYANDVVLQDPVHRVLGLAGVRRYFAAMLANVQSCRFDIKHTVEQNGEAFVSWEMSLVHPKLNSGDPVIVSGVTHLQFNQRIYFHRDYFDMGSMLYEQLPVIGAIVRRIKSGLAV